MADEVKRQHFVPRTYLNKFARQDGDAFYIKALNKNSPETEKIFETNIINVCTETRLYTLPGETVKERMVIEKFYSDAVEQHYDTIYKMLIDPNKTEVTEGERELIIATVVTMLYRTTKWMNQHNEFMARTYTQLFDMCKQTGKDYFIFEGEKISISGKSLDQFIKENKIENRPTKVMTQLEVAIKLIELRKDKDGIFIVKLDEENCEFITSDNPVILENAKGGHIMPFDPSNTMKIPIDKKHMLLLMPYADKEDQKYLIRENAKGERCNLKKLACHAEQFENSERFILGEETSLIDYLKTKEIVEKPLDTEELKKISSYQDIVNKLKDLGIF